MMIERLIKLPQPRQIALFTLILCNFTLQFALSNELESRELMIKNIEREFKRFVLETSGIENFPKNFMEMKSSFNEPKPVPISMSSVSSNLHSIRVIPKSAGPSFRPFTSNRQNHSRKIFSRPNKPAPHGEAINPGHRFNTFRNNHRGSIKNNRIKPNTKNKHFQHIDDPFKEEFENKFKDTLHVKHSSYSDVPFPINKFNFKDLTTHKNTHGK